jgi:chemotaxis protein methyltransferase CheR
MAFTYFFRDAEPLELAIEQLLPAVETLSHIDIWDAGCAHGPEPYTLAILCREKMPDSLFRKVRIHATDVDGCFASQVCQGVFPESELRRLPDGIRDKYFRPLDDSSRFEVVEEIRSKIDFSRHDLLSLKPFQSNLSLIVCKNVLLHFNEAQRCDVLRMFHSSLRTGGVLVTEHTQKMPALLSELYRLLVCHAQIHGKVVVSSEQCFREDGPANVRRPFFKGKKISEKSKNGSLEKDVNEGANEAA